MATSGEYGARDRIDSKPRHVAEVLCAVVVTAAFASPLFLPVMFTNLTKFVTEACVKPVTANGGPMVATAGVANPVQLGRQYA